MEDPLKLHGIIPPIATPFTKSGDIDFQALKDEASFLAKAGVNGIVVGGSGGEGYAMSSGELRDATKAVKTVAREVRGDSLPVLAGIIRNSTREAIEYASAAREGGADGLQMTPFPVYLYKPYIEDLVQGFRDVGTTVGLPIVIYNVVPTNKISAREFRKMSAVEQVVAVKHSGIDIHALGDLILEVGDRFTILSALDDMLLPSFVLGVKGSICGASMMLPDLCLEMFRLYKEGRVSECVPIHWKIFRVVRATMHAGPNNIYPDMIGRIKFAITAQGRNVGYMRAPMSLPGEEARAEILSALKAAGRNVDAVAIETTPE
jgi:4-hydroxy-tetrahydrodipicolinate synthase